MPARQAKRSSRNLDRQSTVLIFRNPDAGVIDILRGAMNPHASNRGNGSSPSSLFDAAIRIGLVAVLVYACGRIVLPFSGILAWSAILAVMLYPLHLRLTTWLGNRWSALLI